MEWIKQTEFTKQHLEGVWVYQDFVLQLPSDNRYLESFPKYPRLSIIPMHQAIVDSTEEIVVPRYRIDMFTISSKPLSPDTSIWYGYSNAAYMGMGDESCDFIAECMRQALITMPQIFQRWKEKHRDIYEQTDKEYKIRERNLPTSRIKVSRETYENFYTNRFDDKKRELLEEIVREKWLVLLPCRFRHYLEEPDYRIAKKVDKSEH